MDDKRLEEKLQLLNKSYDRMPTYLDVDALMDKIEEDELQQAPVIQHSKRRLAIWGAAAAALFACGVLVGPMLSSQNTAQPTMAPLDHRAVIDEDVTFYAEPNELSFEQFERAVVALRDEEQVKLQLPDAQFEALLYVQQADQQFAFYEERRDVYEQTDATYMLQSFAQAYAAPSNVLRKASAFTLTDEDAMRLFLQRIAEVKAAYRDAYGKVGANEQAALTKAAKGEGIEIEAGNVVFSYDEFVEQQEDVLPQLGAVKGLAVMAQFDETLYEVDDLRYAPAQLLPYYDELTHALLTLEEHSMLKDAYVPQFLLATLRLLQGTEKYPLTQQTLQFFIEGEQDAFRSVAETIKAQLEQFGSSVVASRLTYADIEAAFERAQLPYTDEEAVEETWVKTDAFLQEAQQQWEAIPNDLFVYSGKQTVLYYIYAQEQNQIEVLQTLTADEILVDDDVSYASITSIQFTTYGEETVKAVITDETKADVTYVFRKIDDVWKRVQ